MKNLILTISSLMMMLGISACSKAKFNTVNTSSTLQAVELGEGETGLGAEPGDVTGAIPQPGDPNYIPPVVNDPPSDDPPSDDPPSEDPPIGDPPKKNPPVVLAPPEDGPSGEGLVICLIDGPGSSKKFNSDLAAGHKIPKALCMSVNACENIVSQKFNVTGIFPGSKGVCPHNPHVIKISDADLQAQIDLIP